jgi:hypothetical protein
LIKLELLLMKLPAKMLSNLGFNFLLHPWDRTKNIEILFIFFIFYLFFILLYFDTLNNLRCLSNRSLHVVTLEVLLEVEDSKAIRLREAEELAERGIRLDGLLVRKLVVLCILHDATGDIRAADLSAGGEAEEDAKILGDLNRLGEDRRGVGLLLAIGANCTGLAAAAALGLLLKAGDLLLHLLHLRRKLIEAGAESVELDKESSEVGDD